MKKMLLSALAPDGLHAMWRAATLVVCFMVAAVDESRGQCGEWEAVGVPPTTATATPQMIEWDPDGDGPAQPLLVVEGYLNVGNVGPLGAWNGVRWTDLTPPPSDLTAVSGGMCVYQNHLVFNNITSHCFEALDGDGHRQVLAADCGGGYQLEFIANGVDLWVKSPNLRVDGHEYSNGLARYDGSQWHDVPGEFAVGDTPVAPAGLFLWNGHPLVTGSFSTLNGSPATGIAYFDGFDWNNIPRPFLGYGYFGVAHGELFGVGSSVWKWNGTDWEIVTGSTTPSWAGMTLRAYFTQDALYIGRSFTYTSTGELWMFNGLNWQLQTTMGKWLPSAVTRWRGDLAAAFPNEAQSLSTFATRHDGVWHTLGDGPSAPPSAMCRLGDQLAVGGIVAAGGVEVGGVATFDGNQWHTLGGGIPDFTYDDSVKAMVEYNGSLWVAGRVGVPQVNSRIDRPTGLWKWDGTVWQEVPGDWYHVEHLIVHEGSLFAVGSGTSTPSGPAVARLDGSEWTIISTGVSGPVASLDGVLYMAIMPEGSLASWDGQQWSYQDRPSGTGYSLETFQNRLVISGYSGAFYVLDNGIWQSVLPPHFTSGPRTFVDYHDDLVAAGTYPYRWSPELGSRPLGQDERGPTGPGSLVSVLTYDDALYVGGRLFHFSPSRVTIFARWVDTPFCDCDSIDFNRDGVFPDIDDIPDFLSVFEGGVCRGQSIADYPCNSDIDFNNDGVLPDTVDIEAILSVFSGGTCVQ